MKTPGLAAGSRYGLRFSESSASIVSYRQASTRRAIRIPFERRVLARQAPGRPEQFAHLEKLALDREKDGFRFALSVRWHHRDRQTIVGVELFTEELRRALSHVKVLAKRIKDIL